MPRGIHKDAAHLHDILEKGVLLDKDRVEGSVDLGDEGTVYVGVMFDVEGYGPHVGALYITQGYGSSDESLQAADQMLEEWLLDHHRDALEDLEKEYGEDAMSVFTETFDGFAFELSPHDFVEAIRGTDAEKFIDVEEAEEEEPESVREAPRAREGFAGDAPTAKSILEWLGSYMEHEGHDAARESARVARILEHAKNHDQVDKALEEVNRVVGGHGIDDIRIEDAHVDNYYHDIVALYVNMGDSYAGTLLFETENERFVLTTWGDWMEENEQRYQERDEDEETEALEEARRGSIRVGQRVSGGEGDDYDTGEVVSIRGRYAEVAWDSGATTEIPIADLSPTEEKWSGGHRISEARRGPTRLDRLRSSLPKGYSVFTWSPGDGVTRYRFFHNAPPSQDYFGPNNGIYTALGFAQAEAYADGLGGGMREAPVAEEQRSSLVERGARVEYIGSDPLKKGRRGTVTQHSETDQVRVAWDGQTTHDQMVHLSNLRVLSGRKGPTLKHPAEATRKRTKKKTKKSRRR